MKHSLNVSEVDFNSTMPVTVCTLPPELRGKILRYCSTKVLLKFARCSKSHYENVRYLRQLAAHHRHQTGECISCPCAMSV